MERNFDSSQPHFHIHWTDAKRLDWECFDTRADATARALELALPGEIFRIEEISAQCPLRIQRAATAG
jgi:hypothetical protein